MTGFDPIRSLAHKLAPPKTQVAAKVHLPGLMDWIPTVTAGYAKPLHLAPLVHLLEEMGRRPLRAVSSVPPRHGKSETIIHGIVWHLLRHPEWLLAYVSYGDTLVSAQSRRCRRLAQECGVELADDSKSVHEWRTKQGGGLVAQSLMGGLTGRGFKILIFDDPVKNMEEARSEVVRDKVFEEWQATATTRLEPGGSALVNATRWHWDDLIGRLEADRSYERFNMPAISGEPPNEKALWPERYPLDVLKQIRGDGGSVGVGRRVWQALYQGDPSPDEGSIFNPAWFKRYNSLPTIDAIVLVVDGAWKTGVGSDYSVIATWGVSYSLQGYYLLDVWRARVELPELLHAIRDQHEKWKPRAVLIEDAASGIAAIQTLQRETRFAVLAVPTKGLAKETRAERVSPLCESGRVWIPAVAPWVADWVEEHRRFPAGANDDQVDTTSMALWHLSTETYRRETKPFARGRPSLYDL